MTEELQAPVEVKPTPFGLYFAVALATGIVAGLLLVDYVTRPDPVEAPEPSYEVVSGPPGSAEF
ncbi:MAG: hypothetical protein AAF654_04835 [Myxococcota bacterium]